MIAGSIPKFGFHFYLEHPEKAGYGPESILSSRLLFFFSPPFAYIYEFWNYLCHFSQGKKNTYKFNWDYIYPKCQFEENSIQSLSRVRLFATPWTAAHQASLSVTNSWSLLKFIPIKSVMPSNHLILCHLLLLLPSIFPSIRVFSNDPVLHIRWPEYWSFSFSISPSSEHPGLISFRMDWLDLLEVQGRKLTSFKYLVLQSMDTISPCIFMSQFFFSLKCFKLLGPKGLHVFY